MNDKETLLIRSYQFLHTACDIEDDVMEYAG